MLQGFFATTVVAYLLSYYKRIYYYLEYDINIYHPRVSSYHLNRFSWVSIAWNDLNLQLFFKLRVFLVKASAWLTPIYIAYINSILSHFI